MMGVYVGEGLRLAPGWKCIACGKEEVGQGAERIEHNEKGREEHMPDCKRHPGVAAKIGKNGVSTGLCRECLVGRARKSSRVRVGNQLGKRPRRALPTKVARPLPIVAEPELNVFIPTMDLVQPAAELRFEFVYRLAEVKIVK